MSAKRKDSHPAKTSALKEDGESDEVVENGGWSTIYKQNGQPAQSNGLPTSLSVSTTFNSSLPNNINIAQGLALSQAGLTQSQGGLTMTPGLTMSQGGLPMSQAGLSMSQGGLPMSQGALTMSQGGLPMSQSLSVSQANSLPLSQLGQYLSQNGSMSPGRLDISREEDDNSSSGIKDDTSSLGNKDDDDDEDEDDGCDDKYDNSGDPERLKAFNMFVRLFVDENLDRHVPISKQPKEKIQAIIDSCTRQFPEFSDRARKRIRTYLKSCRRTKRSREQAGLDINNRPTPPHLTSVHAEQMLARACENEAENAKRMRIGMEPISQPIPVPLSYSSPLDMMSSSSPVTLTVTMDNKNKMEYKSEQLASLLAAGQQQQQQQQQPITAVNSMNGATAAMYRQALQQQQQQQQPAAVYPTPGLMSTLPTTNGQTLDSLKKGPLLNHKLNGTEMAAVRQLITGYRESAAFLLRSADELEHLIQIQPKL